MAANVSFQLSVVAESYLTVRASESFRPLFLGGSGGGGCGDAGVARRRVQVVVMLVVVMKMRRRRVELRVLVVVMVDRLVEAGQLIELSDFIGSHTESGQLRRVQRFGR